MNKAAILKSVTLGAGVLLSGAAFVTPAFANYTVYPNSVATPTNLVCDRYSPTCMLQQWNYVSNGNTYGNGYQSSSYPSYNYNTNYGYMAPSYTAPSYVAPSYNTYNSGYNNLPNGNYYPYTTIYSTPASTYNYSYQYQYSSTMPAYNYNYPSYSYNTAPYNYSYSY